MWCRRGNPGRMALVAALSVLMLSCMTGILETIRDMVCARSVHVH